MQKFFVKRLAQKWFTSRFCLSLAFFLLVTACAPAPAATPVPLILPETITAPASTVVLSTPTRQAQPTAVPDTASTAEPTPTPAPTITRIAPGVISYESTLELPTYPYQEFLHEELDTTTNIPYLALDREAYDAAQPEPALKTYRTIVLENEYLQLVFLPELGGRLYQAKNKLSNQFLFYNNPVIKPSPWGMSYQGGWLAAGGMEWAFPTQEHGYEWNVPWDAQVSGDEYGLSVTLTDSTANDRPRVRVRVTLPSGGTYFIVEPAIENPTDKPQRIQFWTNAALNPGGTGTVSPQTEFIFPDDNVWIHSTGNEWIDPQFVPPSDATAPVTPVTLSDMDGRDLRRYENWDNYLGVFAVDPSAGGVNPPEVDGLAQNFVAAYNHESSLGVVRVFPPAAAPGVKLFGFGPEFCCVDAYTDDGSEYFELWGGLPRTFFADDDVTLAPGETRTWQEFWLSPTRTGGVSAATQDAVLYRGQAGEQLVLSAYSAVARDAVILLKQNDTVLERWEKSFRPGDLWDMRLNMQDPAWQDIQLQNVQLELQDSDGNVIVVTQ